MFIHNFFDSASGKTRRIDFAIITDESWIAIELDGYKYHAPDVIPREKFSDDLQRQNELVVENWKVIRFTWYQVVSEPHLCRDYLRRSLVGDSVLHPSLYKQEIRPHVIQEEALQALDQTRKQGKKRGLVVMATGLGKTFLAAFDIKRVGGRVLFVVHNNAILEQAKNAFRQIEPTREMGLFNGYEKAPSSDIVFANINSLSDQNHLQSFTKDAFSYIIIDEFHHAATSNYKRVIEYFDAAFILGLTATPNRTDGVSILSSLENNVVYCMTQKDAIDRGFLVPFHYHAFKDNVDYSGIRHNGYRYDLKDLNRALIIERRDSAIIDKYNQMAGGTKSIAFCVSIEHAERASSYFNNHGIPSIAITSKLSYEEREYSIQSFRDGKYRIVFVRDIFNEGIDFPDVETLIFMRPTESKIVFTQQLGRGLRLYPGKKQVKVLDFIGNYINVDRVPIYLSEYGKEIILREGYDKPLFFFDNGCRIEFDTKAVETITFFDRQGTTDIQLIEDFFVVFGQIGRCPTISELKIKGKCQLKNYVQRYGSWSAFIERIKALHPEIDYSNLENTIRSIDTIEEYADAFVLSSSGFFDQVKDMCDSIDAMIARFNDLGTLSKNSKKVLKTIQTLIDAMEETESFISSTICALEFRFCNIPERKNVELKSAKMTLEVDKIKSLLVSICNTKDCYIFANLFSEKEVTFSVLKYFATQYLNGTYMDEENALGQIYAHSVYALRNVIDLMVYARRIYKMG